MCCEKGYPRGFTLIEVFVVIAILAILGTMGWVAKGVVNNRQMNKTAELQVAQMEEGMERVRADRGDVMPEGVGDEWSSWVLYSALYCDADGDGEPDMDAQTNEALIPYCESIVPMSVSKQEREVANGIPAIRKKLRMPGRKSKSKKVYVLADPWGGTYRYRQGYEVTNPNGKTGKGVNPFFDIFTKGPDGEGNGLSNVGKNEDNISNVRSWK